MAEENVKTQQPRSSCRYPYLGMRDASNLPVCSAEDCDERALYHEEKNLCGPHDSQARNAESAASVPFRFKASSPEDVELSAQYNDFVRRRLTEAGQR